MVKHQSMALNTIVNEELALKVLTFYPSQGGGSNPYPSEDRTRTLRRIEPVPFKRYRPSALTNRQPCLAVRMTTSPIDCGIIVARSEEEWRKCLWNRRWFLSI